MPTRQDLITWGVAAVSKELVHTRPGLVRQLREAAGLTQAELADAAKCSQGTISKLEAGTIGDPGMVLSHNIIQALASTADLDRLQDREMAAFLREQYSDPWGLFKIQPTTFGGRK